MAARNPARVLPEPVGAQTSVCWPATIAGQPPAWASVGPSGNRRSNHTRTAGWKRSRIPGAVRPAPETVGVDGSGLTGTSASQTVASPVRDQSRRLSASADPGRPRDLPAVALLDELHAVLNRGGGAEHHRGGGPLNDPDVRHRRVLEVLHGSLPDGEGGGLRGCPLAGAHA